MPPLPAKEGPTTAPGDVWTICHRMTFQHGLRYNWSTICITCRIMYVQAGQEVSQDRQERKEIRLKTL